jgi:hypothetical protein
VNRAALTHLHCQSSAQKKKKQKVQMGATGGGEIRNLQRSAGGVGDDVGGACNVGHQECVVDEEISATVSKTPNCYHLSR